MVASCTFCMKCLLRLLRVFPNSRFCLQKRQTCSQKPVLRNKKVGNTYIIQNRPMADPKGIVYNGGYDRMKRMIRVAVTFGTIICMLLTLGMTEVHAAGLRDPFLYKNPVVEKRKDDKIKKPSKKPVKNEKPTEEASTEEAPTEEASTEETPTEEASTEENTEETTEEMATEEQMEETKVNEQIAAYQKVAAEEAAWLWGQQLSNGAFAFYNSENGSVYINPYFSEIVAIALIRHDNSPNAKAAIENYFDWHFSHINTAEEDYNGLAGTIYDYDAVVKNGVVVSETSKNHYDSTDSYSALFVKALADYAKTYGDSSYILAHETQIRDIVNVMFATMGENGYTYAKPDYKICYLMDNAEVYAGLCAADYLYKNILGDAGMSAKINEAVAFYDTNFNKHWWKGDHYATVLNPDYTEYTGYAFDWSMFYPCATAQMFPILYGLATPDSAYAFTAYNGLCNAWDWQDMDYISEGADVFCWGNFAYLGALMKDEERLDAYLNKYDEIVASGRPYPLYSAESAMVLMGCEMMISQLK